MDRRSFLKGVGVALGALSVGKFPILPPAKTIATLAINHSSPFGDSIAILVYGWNDNKLHCLLHDIYLPRLHETIFQESLFVKHIKNHKVVLFNEREMS